jgi:outer membrane protein
MLKLFAKSAFAAVRLYFQCRTGSLAIAAAMLLGAASVSAQTTPKVLSLDDAISIALGRGEEIAVAKAGIRIAEGGEEVARSGMLPQVSASANYTRTIQSQYSGLSTLPDTGVSGALAKIFSNFPFGKANQWTLALNASQNIYTGGKLTALADAAEARKHSADIDLTAAEAQLVLNVTQSYYDAVLADTLLKISRDALAEAGEADRETELQYQVGEKAEFDALRSRVAMENQIPVVLQSENDRSQAYYRLKQLLNYSLDDSVVLTTPVVDSLTRFAIMSDSATEERSSVIQAKLNINALDAQVRLAQSAHWPQVSISSSYSPLAYPNNLFPNNNDWLANWTAALNVSIPIYTGGSISGNVDQAMASVDQANARLEQVREAAAFDSRVAFDNLNSAKANLRATTSTSSEATRAYDIARVRFTQGISTQLELDDARLQEEQARANWARAMRNYQVARAKLSLLRDLPVTQQSAQASSMGSQPSPQSAVPSAQVGGQLQTGMSTGQ